jgi:hypothetical protein
MGNAHHCRKPRSINTPRETSKSEQVLLPVAAGMGFPVGYSKLVLSK